MQHAQPLQYYADALGDQLISVHGDLSTPVSGACGDSRTAAPGNLFVAIPGARVDGTTFIPEAVAAGVAAVAVAHPLQAEPEIPVLRVADAYVAAARIAEAAVSYPARALRLLGVTGTNGKTTCAHLLQAVLQADGRSTGLIGTVRYETGRRVRSAQRTTPTPFKLQALFCEMVAAGVDHAVMEVSSHALAQRRLGTCRCQVALFTNLTGDHLDYHGTMEEYFRAKRLLFEEYLAPGGTAVINLDDPFGARLARDLQERAPELHCVTFGRATAATVRIRHAAVALDGLRMSLVIPDGDLDLVSGLIGDFNAANIAAVAAGALQLGVRPAVIQHSVAGFADVPGRLELIRADNGLRAFVDYAHTDDALRNVLTALAHLGPERLLVVFGCGGDRDRSKRARMGAAAGERADLVFLTSDNPRSEDPQAIIDEIASGVPAGTAVVQVPERRDAIRRAIAAAEPGDVVLIAGKGHENYQEFEGQTVPFDDRQEVRAAMRAKGILPPPDGR